MESEESNNRLGFKKFIGVALLFLVVGLFPGFLLSGIAIFVAAVSTKDNHLGFSSILKHISYKETKQKDITEYPEAECILKHIEEKLKKKRDYKTAFTGGTGLGKSYSGLRLLELWYKRRFKESFPSRHIVSNLSEAVLLIKDFKRKGEGVLIEEISASAGSRDSNTTQNKLWNKFLDTCRIKQVVLVMNCPHLSFADKHIRMSLDSWVDFKSVDFKRKITLARPLWLQTSPHKAEPYKHRYTNDDGVEIDTVYFRKPSKEISDIYDSGKEAFTEEIYSEIHLKMTTDRQKKLKELGAKFLSKRELEAYQLWLKGYTREEAAEKMDVNVRTYENTVSKARQRLKTPEYRHQSALLDKKSQYSHEDNGGTPLNLTYMGTSHQEPEPEEKKQWS